MGAYSDTIAVDQFNVMMDVQEQQKVTKLSGLCDNVSIQGENWFYDDLGSIEARRENGLNARLQFSDIGVGRRKMTKERIYTAMLTDELEISNLLTDPRGKLATVCTYAHEREKDRVVYDAMFATVYTGRSGATATTFTADGGVSIDATAGLTYEKLLEIKQNLIDNDVEYSSISLGITGDEHTDLMGEQELTSGDYSRQFVVDKGDIQMAAGINLIKFGASVASPILDTVGGERISFAAINGCMVFGTASARKVETYTHPDYVDSVVLKIVETIGAVRKKVNGARLQRVRLTP